MANDQKQCILATLHDNNVTQLTVHSKTLQLQQRNNATTGYLGLVTWMGDRQGRPSAVNLFPFVGVDLITVTDRLYSRHRADTDVK